MTIRAAGLILSSALVLSAAACGRQAAPDCKASIGNAACSSPKTAQPHILPNPPPVANSQAPARAAGQAPAPSHPSPRRLAQRAHRACAETLQGYHRESRQMWEADNSWRTVPRQEQRPPSGPVYESGPGAAMAGGCDEACRYQDWFRRYSDWYNTYARYYRPGRGGAADAPANPPSGPAYSYNGPANYRGGGSLPYQSERDRMDPWHGYNSRDGLETGY